MLSDFKRLFKGAPTIEIKFDEKYDFIKQFHNRLEYTPLMEEEEERPMLPVVNKSNNVAGTVTVVMPSNLSSFDYEHINIFLVGQLYCPSLGSDQVFVSKVVSLESGVGVLTATKSYPFSFEDVDLCHESFYGTLVEIRYFLRAEIRRKSLVSKTLQAETEFYVRNPTPAVVSRTLKMQVGVESCLHIDFEYSTGNLHVEGLLEGTIKFVMNLLKLKSAQIQVLRREVVQTGSTSHTELVNTTTISKFQIMDGNPAKGEVIPVRVFMKPISSLTPTMRVKQFDIKYYLNLVLIDTEGRRYFKSSEVVFWRDDK